MKIILLSISLVILFSIRSFSQNLEWAHSSGSSSNNVCKSIAVGKSGSVYSTGYFNQNVDFDPGIGTYFLNASGGYGNIYIQKLDSSGNFIWAKSFYSTQSSSPNLSIGESITIDQDENIYLSGYFTHSINFGSIGGPNFNHPFSNDDYDEAAMVLKLDSAGNYIWGNMLFSETGHDRAVNVEVDSIGNVYTTGKITAFQSYPAQYGTFTLYDTGIFIQKQDSLGNVLWVKIIEMGTSSGETYNVDFKLDHIGNIYMTGRFNELVDFDPGDSTFYLTPFGMNDSFVLKLDPAGVFIWAHQFGAQGDDSGTGVSIDSDDNVYLTGYFEETVDFDPSVNDSNLTTNGGKDLFIQKLDSLGNLLWVKSIGGFLDDAGYSICNDLNDNLIVTGVYYDTVDFNAGYGENNMTAPTNGMLYTSNLFFLKMDKEGHYVWSHNFATGNVHVASFIDGNNSVYFGGGFKEDNDADPDTSIFSLSYQASGTGIFVIKWSQDNCSDMTLTIDSLSRMDCISMLGYSSCQVLQGTPPYEYIWNTSPITNDTIAYFDSSGTYNVFVTDSSGCYRQTNVTVEDILISDTTIVINATDSLNYNGQVYTNSGVYSQTLTTNMGCDSIVTLVLYLSYTEIEELITNSTKFSIYPNPANSDFTIQLNDEAELESVSIQLFDALGRVVRKEQLTNSKTTFSVQNIKPGIYMVSISIDEKIVCFEKLIKN